MEVACDVETSDNPASPNTAADGGRDVALSSEISWAGLVRRGPSIVRRLRLASGLVLFFLCLSALSQPQPGQHLVGGDGARRCGAGMDLARPSWYHHPLRRFRDPLLARLLGALQPPALAHGRDRGAAAPPRIIDTGAGAAACPRLALRLQLFRHSRDLPTCAFSLLDCRSPDSRRQATRRVCHRLAAWLHRTTSVVAS